MLLDFGSAFYARSGKRILGRVRQALGLVVSDILNAQELEDLKQNLAVMAECNGAVVRVTLLDQNMAVETAQYSLPLCIATVMGGAMFGDNLSFISDTTIAACNGQGCAMKDKFRENFHIALPAALATLVLILVLTLNADVVPAEIPGYHLIQIIPYVLVLVGGIIGGL